MTHQGTPELRALQQRADQIERLLENGYAAIIAMIVIAGLILPFFTEHDTSGDSYVDTPWSVLRMVLAPPSPEDGSADDAAIVVAITVGFVGLAIAAIAVIVMAFITANRRGGTGRPLVFGRVLVALGIAGSLVPVIFSAMAAGRATDDSPGWGGVVLFVGMLGAIPAFRQRKHAGPELTSAD